jgi:hypothetical protein
MAKADKFEPWAQKSLKVYNDLKTKNPSKEEVWVNAIKIVHQEYKGAGGKHKLKEFMSKMATRCQKIQPPASKKREANMPPFKDKFPKWGLERVKEMAGNSLEGAQDIFGYDYADWAGLT